MLALLLGSTSCGGREALGVSALNVVSAGVINDPANKSLRFDVLKFGLERFCIEMRRRGAPIKLSDHEPVIGRFFAESCTSQVLDQADRQSIIVQYSGKGYGYTNMTERLGFASGGLVEYAADFQTHDDSMYIYFRPRSVGGTTFQLQLVESTLAQVGLGLSGIDAEALGRDMVTRQLQRGFTVIRHSPRGDVEFSQGLVPAGQRPFRPFQVVRSERMTLENDRTEVHLGQQDYVGGLRVSDDDQRLHVHATLDGAPAVDVFVLSEMDGQMMTQAYVTQRGGARLPRAPLADVQLRAGQPLDIDLKLPVGNYFLMFDHSPSAGRTQPRLREQTAKIDYLVQLGER